MSPRRDYVRQTHNLLKLLKKEGGTVQLQPADDPMEQLLRGVLSTYGSDSRADTALTKLRDAMVDLNELRVTPIAEMVEIIGADYPMCRAAAAEISRALNSVFNRIHHLDLAFLRALSRKQAELFLNSLDGVGPHAKATVIQRCLKAHVVPVDVHMFAYLQKTGCLAPEAGVEDAHRVLIRRIRERDAFTFYALLKRHAAVHARRRPARAKPKAAARPAKPTPAKRDPTHAAKAPVRKKTVKKNAPAGKPQTNVSFAASAGPKKADAGKKKAASVRKAGSEKTRRPVSKKNASIERKASTRRRR